jgi:photosystem II stability/assembly factor-like uncharacterized protein
MSAAATPDGDVWVVAANGIVKRSHDLGANFERQRVPATETLRKVVSDSQGRLWVAGGMTWQGGGVLLRSSESGQWQRITLPVDACLHSVSFSGKYVLVTGDDGSVFSSDNDGESWRVSKVPNAKTLWWSHIAPDQTISVGGDAGLFVTSTNGIDWTVRDLGFVQDQRAIFTTSDGKRRWIVGEAGMVLHSSDGGTTWESQSSGVDVTLAAIAGKPDGSQIVAVGSDGTLVMTEDLGRTWTGLSQPTSAALNDIIYQRDRNGRGRWFATGNFAVALRSEDGRNWSAANAAPSTNPSYRAVKATSDPGVVVLAGTQGLTRLRVGSQGEAVQETGFRTFNSLAITRSRSSILAAGDNGVAALSQDAGRTWRVIHAPTESNLSSAFIEDAARVLWLGTEEGVVLRSFDLGETWQSQNVHTDQPINGLFVESSGRSIWVTAGEGVLRLSDNGGRDWESVTIPFTDELGEITGTRDGSRLWIAGDRGTVLMSVDRGHTWRAAPLGRNVSLYGVLLTDDESQVWATAGGGNLAKSTNGIDWRPVSLATKLDLYGIDYIPSRRTFIAVGEDANIFTSPDGVEWTRAKSDSARPSEDLFAAWTDRAGRHMWIGGRGGLVLESVDGGMTWGRRQLGTASITDIAGEPDGSSLWAVGDAGTIFHSSDGGVRWNQRVSGTQRDIQKLLITNDRLWAVGDRVLLVSEDRGVTWRRPTIKGDLRPDSFSLLDIAEGDGGRVVWLAGQGGRVYQSTDYGTSWKDRNPATPSNVSAIAVNDDGQRSWVGTENGQISRFNSGPQAYTTYSTSTQAVIWEILRISGRELWATTTSGLLKQSIDAGATWNTVSIPTETALHGVSWASESGTIIVVGNRGLILIGHRANPFPNVSSVRLRQDPLSVSVDLQLEHLAPIDLENVKLFGTNRRLWERNNWEEIPIGGTWNDAKSQLTLSFSRGAFAFADRESVFFEAVIRAGGRRQRVALPPLVLRRWGWLEDNVALVSVVAVVLAFYATVALLLVARPLAVLAVYRGTGLARLVEGLPIPVLGDVIRMLSFGTLLPWFVKRPQVLDAWVCSRIGQLQTTGDGRCVAPGDVLERNPGLSLRYVPLPVQVMGDGAKVRDIRDPTVGDLVPLASSPVVIQIVGPGGVGKSTLARQVSHYLMSSGTDANCRALVIWVSDDFADLETALRERLFRALEEDVEPELIRALLTRQRLVVVVDGLSERSAATVDYMSTITSRYPVRTLIVTSRRPHDIRGSRRIQLRPMPLNSETLLTLMVGLLDQWRQKRLEVPGQPTIKLPMSDQLDLGHRLARLVTIDGSETPITPLLVRLYIDKAVALLAAGRSLDNLPASVPDVYFEYLAGLNPKSASAENFVDQDTLSRVAYALGRLSLNDRFVPVSFSGADAVAAVAAVGGSAKTLNRLVANGVLTALSVGPEALYAFISDPMAEFLAAFGWAQYCGNRTERWRELQADLSKHGDEAEGFRLALKLTIAAYGSRLGWHPSCALLTLSPEASTAVEDAGV